MISALLKEDFGVIIAFLLISLCNCYITTITSLSPAYIGIVLSLVFLVFFNRSTIKTSLRSQTLVLICFAYFIYLIIDCGITGNAENQNIYIKYFIFNQLFFPITLFYLQKCSLEKIKRLIACFVFFSVFIFTVDAIYRVIFATTEYTGLLAFYNYKESGLLFDDSNWSGFMAMLAYCFLLYLRDRKMFYRKGFIPLLFILTVLTISRAAILSCILITMYSLYIKQKKIVRIRLFMLLLPLIVFGAIFSVNHLTDKSFISKLGMVGGLKYYITHFGFHTVFWGNYPGAGLDGRTFLNFWLGGHLYLTRFIDYGLGALILEYGLLLLINFYSRNQAIYIIVPFFVAGFSFAPGNLPYMYMYLALIYVIENSMYKELQAEPQLRFAFKKDMALLLKKNLEGALCQKK